MNFLSKEFKLCHCCMESHLVGIVEEEETTTYKGEEVKFNAIYEYCSNTDSFMENESMMRLNSSRMKKAYENKIKK